MPLIQHISTVGCSAGFCYSSSSLRCFMLGNCLSLIAMPQDLSGKIRVSEMFKTKTGCLFITLTVINVINVSGSVAAAVKSLLSRPSNMISAAADAGPSVEIALFISTSVEPNLMPSPTPSTCDFPRERAWASYRSRLPGGPEYRRT